MNLGAGGSVQKMDKGMVVNIDLLSSVEGKPRQWSLPAVKGSWMLQEENFQEEIKTVGIWFFLHGVWWWISDKYMEY